MSENSILIIDDFKHPKGKYLGAREACKDFFREDNKKVVFFGDLEESKKLQLDKIPNNTISHGLYFI